MTCTGGSKKCGKVARYIRSFDFAATASPSDLVRPPKAEPERGEGRRSRQSHVAELWISILGALEPYIQSIEAGE